jgi:hypothetical protein
MEAEVHLRSAKAHLEAPETQLAAADSPWVSTDKAVVGAVHAEEPVEGHWRQGGQRGAENGSATSGRSGPQKVVRMTRNDQVPVQGPLKDKVWSLQRRAWFIPREDGGQRGRHWCSQERGVGSVIAQYANMTAPRNTPAEQRVVREQGMTADECEPRPPWKGSRRRSKGEAARKGSSRQPRRIETRLTGDGGRVAASVCGDRGWVHGEDQEQQCRQHTAEKLRRRVLPGAQRLG